MLSYHQIGVTFLKEFPIILIFRANF